MGHPSGTVTYLSCQKRIKARSGEMPDTFWAWPANRSGRCFEKFGLGNQQTGGVCSAGCLLRLSSDQHRSQEQEWGMGIPKGRSGPSPRADGPRPDVRRPHVCGVLTADRSRVPGRIGRGHCAPRRMLLVQPRVRAVPTGVLRREGVSAATTCVRSGLSLGHTSLSTGCLRD